MLHRTSTPSPAVRRALRGLRLGTCVLVASVLAPGSARAQLPAPPVTGTSALQIGAWAGVTFTRPEHPEVVEGVDVGELVAAVLAWGRITARASYLVELDMAKRTVETWTGREADRRVDPVRLYAEYAFGDALRVRAGRFLTPFGNWNERHAEPLTWTPTRPLASYRPFAKSLTGVLVAGNRPLGGRELGWAAYAAPGRGIGSAFEEDEESSFARVFGGRVALESPSGVTVGTSLALGARRRPGDPDDDGEEERDEESSLRPLLGVDARWLGDGVEISGEAAWAPEAEERPAEGGVYLQGAVRIAGPLWAVARAESHRPVDDRTAEVGYAGLTWRPGPRFVVKLGRQFTRRPSTRIPDGWFLSFSSLF